jgi:hypothetical protein
MALTDLHAFEIDATAVMRDLRRATSSVLAALPRVERAVDVAEALHLDRSLAWKVWKVGQGEGDLPSPAHIPGRSGFERFLEGAAAAGVSRAVVDAAGAAFREFERLTAVHAGDRASADIMLSSLTGEGRLRQELARRREAFRANSHFLGVQCRTLYQADVLIPAGPRCMPNVGRLQMHIGLRRMRPNLPWIIGRSSLVFDEGPRASYRRVSLGSGVSAEDRSIAEFSSDPAPVVVRRQADTYTVEDELAPGGVGEASAVDIALGELVSNMPRESIVTDALTMPVFTPAERLVFDVFSVDGVVEGIPLLKVNSTVHGDTPYTRGQDYDRIPAFETFSDLGGALQASAPAEVPRYAAMASWLFSRLGVDPGRLRCHRVRMKFPPVPSRVCAHYVLGRGAFAE